MTEQNGNPSKKQICVIVDTNIWIDKPLLLTSTGAALIYRILQGRFKIALPEIIEREVYKNIVSATNKAIDEVEKVRRKIQTIIGKSQAFSYPSKEQIKAAIKKRFDDLSAMSILERIPIKDEHTKRAIDRLIENSLPNRPNDQQFKDSLIWEASKELAKTFETHFITKDTGFYNMGTNIMAKELEYECMQENIQIHLHKDLEDCLSALEASSFTSQLEQELINIISEFIKPALLNSTMSQFLDIGHIISTNIKTFLTEKPDVIAVSFEITYEGIDTISYNSSPRSNVSFTVKGDCSFLLSTKAIEDASFDEIEYCWTDSQGNICRPRAVFFKSAGSKNIDFFKLRAPIEL